MHKHHEIYLNYAANKLYRLAESNKKKKKRFSY